MNKQSKINQMIEIDYAQNNELADELIKFLNENDYSTIKENDLLIVNKSLSKSLLESFLKKTGRSKHKITLLKPNSFLIAIPVSVTEIGLESCEFCGYTSHRELVNVHRRTHQAL